MGLINLNLNSVNKTIPNLIKDYLFNIISLNYIYFKLGKNKFNNNIYTYI